MAAHRQVFVAYRKYAGWFFHALAESPPMSIRTDAPLWFLLHVADQQQMLV
jgi:hypothetical protein